MFKLFLVLYWIGIGFFPPGFWWVEENAAKNKAGLYMLARTLGRFQCNLKFSGLCWAHLRAIKKLPLIHPCRVLWNRRCVLQGMFTNQNRLFMATIEPSFHFRFLTSCIIIEIQRKALALLNVYPLFLLNLNSHLVAMLGSIKNTRQQNTLATMNWKVCM